MKKISLVTLVMALGITVFAQNVQLGLKAGLNVSNLSNSNTGDMGSKLGPHAGLLAHIHMSPAFAIQPELMYSEQGAKYTIGNREHELKLQYINIPLQFQYLFNNGFRLQTGPQVGFLAGVKDKVRDVETGIFTSEDFKTVDFSWSAGVGYLSYSGLGVDARYNFGLSNINDAGSNVLKNNVFQVGLFYMFNNNHKALSK